MVQDLSYPIVFSLAVEERFVETEDDATLALASDSKFLAILERACDRHRIEGDISLEKIKRRLGLDDESCPAGHEMDRQGISYTRFGDRLISFGIKATVCRECPLLR